jgi:lysozyme
MWEGMDKVAKRDMIGTGHPVTYCYGQTDEFGKVKVGTRFTKAVRREAG